MTPALYNLLGMTLIASLFVIGAYVSYRSFRRAGSRIALGKLVLGLALLILILSTVYSMILGGSSGYAPLFLIAAGGLLEAGLFGGVFIGSAVGISIKEWTSGNQSKRTRVAAIWALILTGGIIYVALWQRHESYQSKNRIKRDLALAFVRSHSAVIQKVGSNSVPQLTSLILAKETPSTSDKPVPIGYVIAIDRHIYAIVSTSQSADDQHFTLDCIAVLTDDERYRNQNPCKK